MFWDSCSTFNFKVMNWNHSKETISCCLKNHVIVVEQKHVGCGHAVSW